MKYYPLKNLLGLNTYGSNLIASLAEGDRDKKSADRQNAIINTRFTAVRIYCDAATYKDVQNKTFRFSPDGRGYKTDLAIQNLKAALPELKVLICYQNQPTNIQAEWLGVRTSIYRHKNDDPNKPESYSELASDLATFAARGGTNKNVPDYPLFKSPNWWENEGEYKQEMLKGAGLYDILEGGNEWDNKDTHDNPVTPEQYAAAWKQYGEAVKKVDPNMTVCSSGVTVHYPEVLTRALEWMKMNGGKIDVYQFHCYPFGWANVNTLGINVANGLPPEYTMVPNAAKVVQAGGGLPCIVGEWGYDRHELSDIGIKPFSNYTASEVHAFMCARTILGFASSGVYMAFYYRQFQDLGRANDTNQGLFATTSLFDIDYSNNKETITRRFSGDVFRQLRDLLGDFWFDSALSDTKTKVYRYTDGKKFIIAAWQVEDADLVVINGVNRAKLTENKVQFAFPSGTRFDLQPGDTMKQTAFSGGQIELSSKPVFLLVDGAVTPPAPTPTVVDKGYFTEKGKRVYYILLSDRTWKITNSKYKPI